MANSLVSQNVIFEPVKLLQINETLNGTILIYQLAPVPSHHFFLHGHARATKQGDWKQRPECSVSVGMMEVLAIVGACFLSCCCLKISWSLLNGARAFLLPLLGFRRDLKRFGLWAGTGNLWVIPSQITKENFRLTPTHLRWRYQ